MIGNLTLPAYSAEIIAFRTPGFSVGGERNGGEHHESDRKAMLGSQENGAEAL